jgi:hypothetical protein
MSFFLSIFKPIASLGQFWQESSNSKIFRWNLIFITSQVVFLVWKFSNLPQQIPLYYSLPWGESQLASASSLFLLPTLSIVILLINHLFAISFSKKIPLLSHLLIFTSLIVSFFFLITLLKIVNLII